MLEREGRYISFKHHSDCWDFFSLSQTNAKEKDLPKPTTDLSEDLFKVHDFDVKIDLQVPSAGDASPGLLLVP